MSASIDPQGKGGKRLLTADLNMVEQLWPERGMAVSIAIAYHSNMSSTTISTPLGSFARRNAVLALLATTLALVLPRGARAEIATGPCAELMDPNNAPSADPRIDHLIVDGTHVNVLVPPRYRHEGRGKRYPVLYLFHGAFGDEDSFSTQTDLLAYSASLDDDDQVIAVMPDGGHLPAGRDWVDGTHPQETFVIDTLLPYVDANYRTIPDGFHRAAAGFSAGGLDAMIFAARHPELFAAAASFSGFLDPYNPAASQILVQFPELDNELCGANDNPFAIWGDPSIHPMGFVGHDPVYLPKNFRQTAVYFSSGNGNPCPSETNPDPSLESIETIALTMAQAFDQALTSVGIPHVAAFRSCGQHDFSNSNQGLRDFWPQMLKAFGGQPPREFTYRSGDPSNSAWGWTFAADPTRAAELLDASEVSANGLRLTGSGTATVTTATIFRHNQTVGVFSGDSAPQILQANAAGQLTFAVDLGPAHTLEEYTSDEQSAAASNSNYFTSRSVRFWPLDMDQSASDR